MAPPSTPPIAILGMACVFPGAESPEELWLNVLAGRRYFRQSPAVRLPVSDYYNPDPAAPDKTYSAQMALITDWVFDPIKFRIPPNTVRSSDLTHWLALYTADAALRDAGLALDEFDHQRAGVVLGNTLAGEFARSHYLRFRWPYVARALDQALARSEDPQAREALVSAVKHYYQSPLPPVNEDTLAGNMANTMAGRICNYFDLGGGGYIVDGACSSSLLAVATACNHLLTGEMDLVLAGGVDISQDPFEIVGFAKAQALAKDDIRPYAAQAAGMLTGEGCGICVLARAADAEAAGWPIQALVRGWGVSSDGRGGITSPEVEGQKRALSRAYQRAGYSIASVDLIEGHGTGTPLGDRVELTALLETISAAGGEERKYIGSIKGNIGHCKAAAGMAGLIKAVMALRRKVLPPTVNCNIPSPVFQSLPGRLAPLRWGMAWQASSTPRRASVSAMGFGGSNCHITLEESNPEEPALLDDLRLLGSAQSSEVFLLSAGSLQDLLVEVEQLQPLALQICQAEMIDLAAALAHRDAGAHFRLALVCSSPADLARALERVQQGIAGGKSLANLADPVRGVYAGQPIDRPVMAMLFPGQGSQRVQMGTAFLRRYPFAADLYAQVENALDGLLPESLQAVMHRDPYEDRRERTDRWEAQLRQTQFAQPAIVLTSLICLRVLQFIGLSPQVSLGHSLGEISALCAAGGIDETRAVVIAALRGRAMAQLRLDDPGAMAALGVPAEEVPALIAPWQPALQIANFNAPRQTVVSGTSAAVDALLQHCAQTGKRAVRLPVSHAFHSALVSPAASAFEASLAPFTFAPFKSGMISTATGEPLDAGQDVRRLLGEHIRRPVRFVAAVERAQQQFKPDLWVEMEPGGVLTGLVEQILDRSSTAYLPASRPGEDTFHALNQVAAQAYVLGFPLQPARLFAHRLIRPFDPDHYDPVWIVNPCERPVDPLPEAGVFHLEAGGLTAAEHEEQADPVQSDRQFLLEPEEQPPTGEGPVDAPELLALAVDWIVRKTGFSPDWISAGTRLRDDLNLDSIKATQMILALSLHARRVAPADPRAMVNDTLGEIIAAILDSPPVDQAGADAENSLTYIKTTSGSPEVWLRTFHQTSVAAPLEAVQTPAWPPGGFGVVVTADTIGERTASNPRAAAIAQVLESSGLQSRLLSPFELVAQRNLLPDLTALVVVLPAAAETFLACTPEEFGRRLDDLVVTLFTSLGWPVHWRQGELDGVRALVLRPAGWPDDPGIDLDAGAAFIKSLQLEYPQAQLKWVSLPDAWPAHRWAETALTELQSPVGNCFCRYQPDGKRFTQAARLLPACPGRPYPFGAGDVVLATGGARGITAELSFELARLTGVKLALVGSTRQPDAEMERNFKRLRQADIPFTYAPCDITDLDAVRRAVADITTHLGPPRAVLHGAGLSKLHRFQAMNLDEFLRCVRVKALGLFHLLQALPVEQLKAVHVLSSVLGQTGMRSQSDYTLANAWLDLALAQLQDQAPDLDCLALDYSLWGETGIGQKLDLFMGWLLSSGVTPISTQDGVAAYTDLMVHSRPSPAVLVTGRLTPELEAGLFAPIVHPERRFLQEVLRFIPAVELFAQATVSHHNDPYLGHHVVDGAALFPGVMALEMMVSAAQELVDAPPVCALQNVRFHHPLIVPAGEQRSLRLHALADRPAQHSTRVRVAVRSDMDGFQKDHFSAECLFREQEPYPAEWIPMPELGEPLDISPEDFMPLPLFQGQFFQHICAIHAIDPDGSLTRVRIPPQAEYYGPGLPPELAMPYPAARDAFLQSGALALPAGVLPVGVEEIQFHRRLSPGMEAVCYSRIRSQSDGMFKADLFVYTVNGEPVETWLGLSLRSRSVVSGISPDAAGSRSLPNIDEVIAGLAPIVSSLPCALAWSEVNGVPDANAAGRTAVQQANRQAARQAAVTFAAQHLGRSLDPQSIRIEHQAGGKPRLCFGTAQTAQAFASYQLSLADSDGLSLAWIAPPPLGIDVERLHEPGDVDWAQLLGQKGGDLAKRLAEDLIEPFERAACRVWTILECLAKAHLAPELSAVEIQQQTALWTVISGLSGGRGVRLFSTVFGAGSTVSPAVLTLLVPASNAS